jgi:hypothetical protein
MPAHAAYDDCTSCETSHAGVLSYVGGESLLSPVKSRNLSRNQGLWRRATTTDGQRASQFMRNAAWTASETNPASAGGMYTGVGRVTWSSRLMS